MLAAHRLLDDPGNPLNEFLPVSGISSSGKNSKWNIGHGMISLYNQKQDESIIPSLNRGVLKPKLAICITMYNESRKELGKLSNKREGDFKLKIDCPFLWMDSKIRKIRGNTLFWHRKHTGRNFEEHEAFQERIAN